MTEELEKWSKVHENVREIEEFLVWLNEKGIVLCEYKEDTFSLRYFIARKTFRELLEEFYKIDAVKLEQERRKLLYDAQEKTQHER